MRGGRGCLSHPVGENGYRLTGRSETSSCVCSRGYSLEDTQACLCMQARILAFTGQAQGSHQWTGYCLEPTESLWAPSSCVKPAEPPPGLCSDVISLTF